MMPQRPKAHTQSHVVGPALAEGGVRTTAYQACVALVCSACGRAIPPDAFFSRRSRKVAPYATGQLHTVPVCMTCRPLQVEDHDGADDRG